MKKTETVRASEPHACIALSVSVRHSGVYPRCSDWCFDRKTLGSTMAVDKAAVWPASVLTALSAFKEQQFLFLFPFCGEVDHFCSVLHLVSSSPQISFDSCGSECSDYSSSTRPWPRANVLLSTVPVKLWETGRSSWAAALNIYISWEVQGEFRPRQDWSNISTLKNTWLFTSRKDITAYFMAQSKKKSYHNKLFTSISTGRLFVRAVSLY